MLSDTHVVHEPIAGSEQTGGAIRVLEIKFKPREGSDTYSGQCRF